MLDDFRTPDCTSVQLGCINVWYAKACPLPVFLQECAHLLPCHHTHRYIIQTLHSHTCHTLPTAVQVQEKELLHVRKEWEAVDFHVTAWAIAQHARPRAWAIAQHTRPTIPTAAGSWPLHTMTCLRAEPLPSHTSLHPSLCFIPCIINFEPVFIILNTGPSVWLSYPDQASPLFHRFEGIHNSFPFLEAEA